MKFPESRNDFIRSIPVYLQVSETWLIFDILPLSSYALNPTMLPLLQTFLELLLYSFQHHCHFFLCF